jgi:uncharacterized protein (DUF305 family)
MRTFKRYAAPAAFAAAFTLLAACGSDDETTSGHGGMGMNSPSSSPSSTAVGTPARGTHKQADVDFATGMIPHHGQALVMADMALRHRGSASFTALATAIKAAQKPEIDQMSGWLAGWGQPVPNASAMNQMGSNSMGMMSDDDLVRLDGTTGSTFERMWLRGMIAHHEGAVDMSETELTQGSNPEAKSLAQRIITAQTAEIAQMRSMLS